MDSLDPAAVKAVRSVEMHFVRWFRLGGALVTCVDVDVHAASAKIACGWVEVVVACIVVT